MNRNRNSHVINVLASQARQLRKRPGKQCLFGDTFTPHSRRGDRAAYGDRHHYSARGKQITYTLWTLVHLVDSHRGAYGYVLDVERLCWFVPENNTKYAGYTTPSTYPARLGFLFVGLCILYILREVMPPRIFHRSSSEMANTVIPSLLVATGLVLTLIITLRLNP